MAGQAKPVVVGTATLDQVAALLRLGVTRDRAKMYTTAYAAQRIRQLKAQRTTEKSGRQTYARRASPAPSKPCVMLWRDKVWTRITSLARKYPDRCEAAVAFVGSQSTKILPIQEGSLLVVNMSEGAVVRGLTNPHEVRKFIDAGVEVHTVENLHAKVVVFPNRAIVGSMNVSRSSTQLVEAATEVTARGSVLACRKFVRSLVGARNADAR